MKVEFYFAERKARNLPPIVPPFVHSNTLIMGSVRGSLTATVLAAQMFSYPSVSAQEQRTMVENTLRMCEMLSAQHDS